MTEEATTKKPATRKAKRSKKSAPAKKSGRKTSAGKGKRYTDKQKLAKLQKYQQLLESGVRAPAAAKKVGVSYITLLAWQKKLGVKIKARRGGAKKKTAAKAARKTTAKRGRKPAAKRGRKPAAKRGRKPAAKRGRKPTKKSSRKAGKPASRQQAAKGGGLVLVTPQGYRIEGISPRDLVKMMKALS